MLCAINRRISSMFVLLLKSWINSSIYYRHKRNLLSSESGQLVSSTYWYVPWRFEYSLQLLERRDQLFSNHCLHGAHRKVASRFRHPIGVLQLQAMFSSIQKHFLHCKMLVGGSAPNPFDLHFQCRLRLPAGYFWRCQSAHPTKNPVPFLAQESIEEFDGLWYNSRHCVLCGLHTNRVKRSC